METANNTAMHVTETKTLCSSPNCPKTKNEDITSEREEELLYGSIEDGDDEDALSDDSFRLRVSDEGEEQQAANRDLTGEVMKQKSTEMELGSDVPPSDITERKSLLKCENLTNGTCTIENHVSHRVEGANEGMHVEDSCNGDIDKSATASIESSKIENSSTDKWHYSGRFGEYSRVEKRNIVPRQSYVMNSCSEKYYNQNTHYGRGKICGKGYSFHNTQGSRVNIEASSPNNTRPNPGISSSAESTIDRSKSKQDADSIASPNMNAECSRVEASSAANTCSSEFATKSEDVSVACDVLTNITPEPTDILTNNDNAEAAYNCTNNSDSTFQVNQGENISPKAERSSPIMDHEASELDVDDEKAVVRVINETDSDPPVGESVNTTEIHAGEEASFIRIPLNNAEGEVELPNTVSEVKTEESETFERINENKTFEDTDDSTNDGIVSENTRVLENNENLASERNNEMVENEKVTLDGEKAKNHETVATGVTNCVNDEGTESEETYVTINDDRVTSEAISDSENDKITASETPEGFTHDEKATAQKVDECECAKPGESMPNSIVTNHEKESPDRDEAEVIKVDDRENDIVESVDETLDQTSQSSDRPAQSDSVKEDADGSVEPLVGTSLVSPEMLTNFRALKLPSDLLIVTIVEPKTNEDGSALFPIEPDTAAAPEIPLTDNEKKDCSSGEGDGVDRPSSDPVVDNATMFRCSLKRALNDILLDEMELSKRLQIDRDRGDVTSESGNKAIDCAQVSNVTVQIETTGRKNTSILENTVTNSNGESSDLVPEESIISNNVVEKSSVSERSIEEKTLPPVTESQEIDDDEKVDDCEVIEIPIKRKQKRSRRSLNNLRESIVSQEDSQETENIRQKRKTAQNAEEIIRKECLANTDSESNDSLSKFVTINHRTNNNLRPTSPPTLKRNFVDDDEAKDVGTTTKKLKADATLNGDITTNNESVESENKRTLQHVRNFFRRDANGSLCKLMQEELEELLIQKVVETITMKGEIGKLREQAKAAERNQEATRIRCQQLAKQIKDLDMVLNRFKSDLRSNPDSKTVVPIKINRSVGLQVNFVTDHGIQNLRQLQQVQKMTGSTVDGTIVLQQQMQQQKQPAQQPQPLSEPTASGPAVKRTVKVRSPRRPEHPATAPVATAVSTSVNSPHVSSVTPAALVVSKPVSDSRPSVTPANQQITVMHPQLISSNQAILVNGNVTSQPIRQAPTLQASKAKNSDLIDLTQEEEKTKPPMVAQNTVLTAALAETSSSVSNVQKLAPRYHSVIQTIPNMSITTQSGIRVVQPSSQPTPTALVNNMNAPRLTYVTMQSGIVPRQVVLTSAPTPIRPAPTNNIRTTFPISGTITNNTVRVMPATGTTTLLYKHPAALPESLNPLSSPSWKLPPPAPSLKISKVANGIVLSWNMALSDKFADIASYQLYAYQELTGMAPSSTLWKKVGDVRALPLPMACTLTQFSEGNNYYFAVRAVDKHSRLGQYSQPGNISL